MRRRQQKAVCQRTPAFTRRKRGFSCNFGKNKQVSSGKWSPSNSIVPAFQIHGSIFKPDPSRNCSQAPVVCITHSVFLLCVRKNPLNGFFALRIKLFRTFRFPHLFHQIQILLPDMCGVYFCPFSFAPHFALQGQFLHCVGVLRYVRLPSRSVVVCLNIPPQEQV